MTTQDVFYYVVIVMMLLIVIFIGMLTYAVWAVHKTLTSTIKQVEHRFASFSRMHSRELMSWGTSSIIAFALSRIRGIFRRKT